MSTKLQRNLVGGVAGLVGAGALHYLGIGELGVVAWFIYCAAAALGANHAHGKADVASIEKGLQQAK